MSDQGIVRPTDRSDQWRPQERLPALAEITPAKHKRCISFQETQLRERIMRKSGAGSALRIDSEALSKYNDTLEEISKLIGKPSGRPKRVSIDEAAINDFRVNPSQNVQSKFKRMSTESRLGQPSLSSPRLGSSNRLRLEHHKSNASSISAQNHSRESTKRRGRLSLGATGESARLEKELLLEYLDCLQRAAQGEDILKQQATLLFGLESEHRQAQLRKSNTEKEKTILESLDGSSYQSRTIDNRGRLDKGSHQSLIQYKVKLQEVNKQMSVIEQYRSQIDSLESDLSKIDARRDQLLQKLRAASDIRLLQEVVYCDAEKRQKNLSNLESLIEALGGASSGTDPDEDVCRADDLEDGSVELKKIMDAPTATNEARSSVVGVIDSRQRLPSKDKIACVLAARPRLASNEEFKSISRSTNMLNADYFRRFGSHHALRNNAEEGPKRAEIWHRLSSIDPKLSASVTRRQSSFKILKKSGPSAGIEEEKRSQEDLHGGEPEAQEQQETSSETSLQNNRRDGSRQKTQVTFKGHDGAELPQIGTIRKSEDLNSQADSSQNTQEMESASREAFKKKPQTRKKSIFADGPLNDLPHRGKIVNSREESPMGLSRETPTRINEDHLIPAKPQGPTANGEAQEITPKIVLLKKVSSTSTGKEEIMGRASYSSKQTEFQKPRNFAEKLNKLIAQKKQSERQSYRHFNRDTEIDRTRNNERWSYRDPRALADPRAGIREDILARQAREKSLKAPGQEDSGKLPSSNDKTRKELSGLNTSSEKLLTSDGGINKNSGKEQTKGLDSRSESCNQSEQMIFIEQSPLITPAHHRRIPTAKDVGNREKRPYFREENSNENEEKMQSHFQTLLKSRSQSNKRRPSEDSLKPLRRSKGNQGSKSFIESAQNLESVPPSSSQVRNSVKKPDQASSRLSLNAFYTGLENIEVRRNSADLEDEVVSVVSHNSSFRY